MQEIPGQNQILDQSKTEKGVSLLAGFPLNKCGA